MTAIQELIQKLEKFVTELDEKYEGDPLVKRGVLISISEAKKQLPKERQQIEEACIDFLRDCHEHIKYSKYKSASDYFTQTYQQ